MLHTIINSMSDSILYLKFANSEGQTSISNEIPFGSVMRLTKVCINWNSQADSAINGSLVNLDIGFFDHNRVNSNKIRDMTSIPLFNDPSKEVSLYTIQMPIAIVDDISQTFTYKLTDSQGNLITNFQDIQIVMAYRN